MMESVIPSLTGLDNQDDVLEERTVALIRVASLQLSFPGYAAKLLVRYLPSAPVFPTKEGWGAQYVEPSALVCKALG